MNEVHGCASGWVQRAPGKVATMIDGPGHPTGHPRDPRETTMLKTIAAALLAVSVLAAPAMAGSYGRTTHNPEIRFSHVTPGWVNSNARWDRHHHRHHHKHFRHHYRFHNHR